MNDEVRNIYFIRNGRLVREQVTGFGGDIKAALGKLGLRHLRAVVNADLKSPVMVVVK